MGADSESDSEENSVYEESQEFSDEDIMVEIVRDRLLNGWTSEDTESSIHFTEDEGEYQESSEIDVQADLLSSKPIIRLPLFEEPYQNHYEDGNNIAKSNEPDKVKNLGTPKSRKVCTPQISNPWLALAAMNVNANFKNQPQYQTPISKPKAKTVKHKNNKVTPISKSIPKSQVTQVTSTLLKRPVTMTLVADAAAALMQSPAAIRAFSELRKREMEKYIESIHPNSKPSGASVVLPEKIAVDVNTFNKNLKDQPRIMTKAVEALSKILKTQSHETLDDKVISLDDILEDTQFDTTPSGINDKFEGFRKVPIGTFWNSQRKTSKLAKKRDLQKAIKKSTSHTLLDCTLLESIKGRKKFLMSPMLETSDCVPVIDDEIIINIPPPLNILWL